MNYDYAIYHSLLPLIIALECAAVLFTYFALTWNKRQSSEETLSRIHKSFIGIFLIEFWYWITRPLLSFFKYTGMTPNNITSVSIILSFVTGAIFATGHISVAGWMLVFSGSLDMLDGALARETGTSTKAGAFFDSCGDRYSDSFVFIGIGIYFLSKNFIPGSGSFTITMFDYINILIILAILLGSASMSYVKARGEAVGVTTKSGLMQRPERITMLSIYCVLDPFIRIILGNYGINKEYGLLLILAIMAVLINFSAVMRMIDIFRTLKSSES